MNSQPTYMFAGGGSGGHLYPGIAVAEEIRRRNPHAQICFVGSERPIEQTILSSTGFRHLALPVEAWQGLRRELRRGPHRTLWNNSRSIWMARQLLRETRPQWVIGLGGYVSVPTVLLASWLGIPVLLIEQNVIPGSATRWLSRCATHICLSFEETRDRLTRNLPIQITGNPVRQNILSAADIKANQTSTDKSGPRTLLILGGSQGAVSINEAVTHLVGQYRHLLEGWRIVHQTGPGRSDQIRDIYRSWELTAVVEEFFPNVAEWYAAADFVISRAGATTLAELACVGCPSLLVPYPFAADQHQQANAEVFARQGAARVVQQGETPPETALRLQSSFDQLLRDPCQREQMHLAARHLAKPHAAMDIVNLIEQFPGRENTP